MRSAWTADRRRSATLLLGYLRLKLPHNLQILPCFFRNLSRMAAADCAHIHEIGADTESERTSAEEI